MAKTREEFEEYHANNPEVFRLFCYFTKQVMNAGYQKYSAEAIFNQIRWYTTIETRGEDFKINNDYKPYYSRKFMKEFNSNVFRTRASVADIK
tara:strand:+ start:258 stop:536 length:279 start_codon:yes stop_codon:yes gene_type:complete